MHKIEHSFINAAIQSIPNKISCKRSYNHKYTLHSTLLHLSLKKLSQLIKITKTNKSSTNISSINHHIQSINLQAQCNLQLILSPNHIEEWIIHASDIWKQLYHTRNMKNSLLLRQQIQNASEKRCETLVSHPKQAINSILNRYHEPIHFSNIKLPNQLITEPNAIKQHIQNHFENWTAYRSINHNHYQNFWQQHYQPQPHINPNWYNSLTETITTEEVLNTIVQLPNGKACGPTGISYEMIKHASPTCIQAITALFNRCLDSGQVPKQ